MAENEGISRNQTVDAGIDARLQTKLIAETIAELEGCQSFAGWVRDQDLQYILRRSGLQTLFVPTNEAFRVPVSGDPEEIINRHLLSGAWESFDLSRTRAVENRNGEVLPVSEGGTEVGGARIVRADVPCTNGVIHVVGADLQPVSAS